MKVNPFHLFSFASHSARSPEKSTPAAEILSASEAVDEMMTLKNSVYKLAHLKIATMITVHLNDLYHAPSSKNTTIDKSVLPDVNAMTIYSETAANSLEFIAGSFIPADVRITLDSLLTKALVFSLATVVLKIELSSCELIGHDKSFGLHFYTIEKG